MREVVADRKLIAYCGLYCGSCRAYLKEKCAGCKEDTKKNWCATRKCCIENNYESCVDCKIFEDITDCKKLFNVITWFFRVVFKSNRKATLNYLKHLGYDDFAVKMAEEKIMSLKEERV